MPAVKVDDVKVAWPAVSATGGWFTPSTLKVTLPVGVPVAGVTAATVAVKVTFWLKKLGLGEPLSVVAVEPAVNVKLAVLETVPLPASVDPTTPVVLLFTPGVVPVTFTVRVQEAEAAREPPLRLIALPPAVALNDPPQEPVTPLGVATNRPAGKESLKLMPLRPAVVFGLLIVKVSEVEPPGAIEPAPKALEIVGGDT